MALTGHSDPASRYDKYPFNIEIQRTAFLKVKIYCPNAVTFLYIEFPALFTPKLTPYVSLIVGNFPIPARDTSLFDNMYYNIYIYNIHTISGGSHILQRVFFKNLFLFQGFFALFYAQKLKPESVKNQYEHYVEAFAQKCLNLKTVRRKIPKIQA